MIRRRDAAIISAYTGVMLGNFSAMQELGDELMGRPTWTHEYGQEGFVAELKRRVTPLFMALPVEGETNKPAEYRLNQPEVVE